MTSSVSVSLPVTLEAAEKDPTMTSEPADARSRASRSLRLGPPEGASSISTTSAPVSRQGRIFEWCSYGPIRTVARPPFLTRASISSNLTRRFNPEVAPEPEKMVLCACPTSSKREILERASSRSEVQNSPTNDAREWVFA